MGDDPCTDNQSMGQMVPEANLPVMPAPGERQAPARSRRLLVPDPLNTWIDGQFSPTNQSRM